MLIFLDFDDVIFNTKKFRKDYFSLFRKQGVSKETFEKFYYDPLINRSKLRAYSPIEHIKRICKKEKLDYKEFKKDILLFTQDTQSYVFGDVVKFLQNFSKENLYIISFSKTEFQKTKIFNSGIVEFFKQVKITNDSKGEEVYKIIKNKQNQLMFFIDDKVEHIKTVKLKNPQIITILLSRKEGRYNDNKNKYCNYQAINMKEVLNIINTKQKNEK